MARKKHGNQKYPRYRSRASALKAARRRSKNQNGKFRVKKLSSKYGGGYSINKGGCKCK